MARKRSYAAGLLVAGASAVLTTGGVAVADTAESGVSATAESCRPDNLCVFNLVRSLTHAA